jgi:flagellar biosynthesis protein FlhF
VIRKFAAANTREALRLVRDAMGPNAIILSNRQVADGVEIMAVADADMASLTADAGIPRFGREAKIEPLIAQPLRPAVPHIAPAPPLTGPETEASSGALATIVKEIQGLKHALEGQLSGIAWGDLDRRDPARTRLMRVLLTAGFSSQLARKLADRLPPGSDAERTLRWARAALAHNLPVASEAEDVIDQGGVYALVGPTGVGKTTTVAKLAARATLKFGADKLALITTDTYRIGAQDQLRIYGRILNVPVFAARTESEFDLTLSELAHKHLVLIDTVGMGQRDRRLGDQADFLCGASRPVRRILLVNAPSQGGTLEDVARAYQGPGLAGCILSKLDEAPLLGPALDVIIRHRMRLFYLTNGQRVPEDLHSANSAYLMDRALRGALSAANAFVPQEGDFPVLMTLPTLAGNLWPETDKAESIVAHAPLAAHGA